MNVQPMNPYAREDDRWAAVVARDRAADGAFVCAVVTTGIYCRPSCASRRPLRENVRFFDRPEDAARAGFRPCLRCGPGADSGEARTARIVRACRLLEGEDRLETRELARKLGIDVFRLQREFRREVGVAPQAYRRRVLAERARDGLRRAPDVSTAIYGAGYSSSSRFYDGLGRELGMAPRQARAGGAGARVRFALRRSSLGVLVVAWTERGVCDVQFADSDAAAARSLRERWPAAELEGRAAPAWVDEVVELVERPRRSGIPLDIQGTAFQARVWEALRRIPLGETRSYAEVAADLGAPTAARAVARACATNPVAVLVPCHRVVRGSGALAGYRWGEARKRELLRRERER
jgi:AraC family transcriptional regulator of adaptative response/methylated-DNA-[protein]-cysteine methyltransferase